LPVEIKLTKPD